MTSRRRFAADDRPDAFERLIDRLLASPQFGEHIARQWLDVAGYADSDGYLAADRLRPQAWRYRDYVIQALNADLPYDQFVTEQLAGDELSDWRRADEITPQMARQLAATGFLRTASDPTYPGYIEPNEMHQVMADTQQIVSTSLLGFTMQCCRCHAHKYDPIPQRDYYALQAVFFPALDPAKWQPSEVRGIPLASEPQLQRLNEHNAQVDARVGQLNKELLELAIRFQLKRVAELLGPAGSDAELVKNVATAINAAADKRTEEQKALVAKYAPNVALGDKELAAWSPEYAERIRQAQSGGRQRNGPQGTSRPRSRHDRPGRQTERLQAADPRRSQQARSGSRARCAGDHCPPKTFSSRRSPATKRPAGGGFRPLGDGSAEPAHRPRTRQPRLGQTIRPRHRATVANFGRSGVKPTHPELLDWLAREFADTGWGQKRLYRELVASSAWRQSSTASPAALAADPNNDLLGWWRAQRHTGEMLRDSTLSVSGKLNAPDVRPADRRLGPRGRLRHRRRYRAGNRRSIYLQVRRSQHVTMLDLFDVPMMEVNCPERTQANVPLSALALLHSPFSEQSGAALADRILREAPADDAERASTSPSASPSPASPPPPSSRSCKSSSRPPSRKS